MSAVETGEMSETVCFFAYAGLLVTSTWMRFSVTFVALVASW